MPKAAAIYARISSDPEGDRLGVTRQVEDCQAIAAPRGWPGADAVVVWHADRLHRHPRELEEFFEVCVGAKVTAMASVTGEMDLSTHDGQFLARILGAVARKESDDKSRRITRN